MSAFPAKSIDHTTAARLGVAGLMLVGVPALLLQLPWKGRPFDSIYNLAHGPMFALATWLLLWSVRRARHSMSTQALLVLLVVAASCVLEFAQTFSGRNANVHDILSNAAGALAGWVFFHASQRRGNVRVCLGLFAGVLMFVFARSDIATVYDSGRQRFAFPLLGSFEDELEITRWWNRTCALSLGTTNVTDGRYSLRVDTEVSDYPAIKLFRPPGDWSTRAELSFDVLLAADASAEIDLTIKVVDEKSSGDYRDRSHHTVRLTGDRPQHIVVPLEQLSVTESGRKMDTSNVRMFEMFLNLPTQEYTLYFDNVRLAE